MVWETRRRELKSAPYELFVILVTVLSIVNLVLAFALRTNQAMQDILKVMNIVLSLILFCDFVYRFATADARAAYFWKGFGWADLFASLPIPAAFLLRTFRLVRVSRLLRKQGLRAVALELGERRAGSTFLTMLFLGVLVLEFGSLVMLGLEQNAPGSQHHHDVRRTVVHDRDDRHRRLRRRVSRHRCRPDLRFGDHRHRGGDLRHLHWLLGQRVSRPQEAHLGRGARRRNPVGRPDRCGRRAWACGRVIGWTPTTGVLARRHGSGGKSG